MPLKERLRKALHLFLIFLKIGAFTFGGGYAMIPLIQREIVEEKKWISENDLLDMIAISESTPGPLGINMATYVGYTTSGVLGSFVATMGIVLPTVLLVLCIAKFLQSFKDNKYVQGAMYGLRPPA